MIFYRKLFGEIQFFFKFQNKCIHFHNWIKGGIIYVKDLFDMHGNFHNESFILSKILSKRDWIREYTIVKRVLKPYLALFNTSLAYFVNIKIQMIYCFIPRTKMLQYLF